MSIDAMAFLSGLFDGTATAGGPQDLQPDPSDLTDADPVTAGPSGTAGAGSHPQDLPGCGPLGANGDYGDAGQDLQPQHIDATGPAPLQPHGDGAPQAMPHGQDLGAQVAELPPTDAHGDGGGADGSQNLAAVPQAMAGPAAKSRII